MGWCLTVGVLLRRGRRDTKFSTHGSYSGGPRSLQSRKTKLVCAYKSKEFCVYLEQIYGLSLEYHFEVERKTKFELDV